MSCRCRWRSALSAIRKVVDAVWLWSRCPEEIESDLLVRGVDIGLWHRLTINPDTGAPYLSSRRLLLLLEHLPDDSAVKTAARGGRWSDWKRMLAEVANEAYRFRASYHAVHSTEDNDVRFDPSRVEFVDPVVAEVRAELERAEAEVAAQTEPDLADAGWM